jgi:4-amino-4-deoxy-L-arabinose transferase-like glycosyltransferase
MQRRDIWILRSVFFAALAARLVALAITWDPALKFEKFFLAARQLMESGWMPDDAFAYSPAYIYFLAVLMRIGATPVSIALVQTALGAVTCVAICELARRLFGRREALIAGAAAALFGPLIIYDISFESDAFGLLFYVLAALALVAAIDRPHAWRFGLAGLLLGLRAVQRPDILIVVPIALLVMMIVFGRQWTARRTARYGAAFCGMLLLPIWPIAAMNQRATGDFVPVMSSPGWVFYASNNYAATGLSYYPPPLALEWMQGRPVEGEDPLARLDDATSRRVAGLTVGHALSAQEASRFWMREGLQSVRRRGAAQIGLQLRKLFYMFHGYEGHDNLALLIKERKLGPLVSVGMGILAPFALLGLFLLLRRRGALNDRVVLLAALLAAPILTMSLFYVGPRFRIALQALLLPIGAFALASLWGTVRRREWRAAAGMAASVVLMATLFNVPWRGIDDQKRSRAVQLETFLGQRAKSPGAAEAHLRKATRLALYPAEAEAAYAGLARRAGQRRNIDVAQRYDRIAHGLLPDDLFARMRGRRNDAEALWAIGRHHLLSEDPEAAVIAFAKAARLAPHDPDLLFAQAIAAYESGSEPPEVVAAWIESALDLGLRFSPGAVPAYILAGRCYLKLERRDEAEQAFVLALRRAPGNGTARALLERAQKTG